MIPLSRITLLKQGSCCGNGCRNCPYLPRHTKGSKRIEKSYNSVGIKSLSGISKAIEMWNDRTHSELVKSITMTCETTWETNSQDITMRFDTDVKPYSDFERILSNVLKYLEKSRDWKSDYQRIVKDNECYWDVIIYHHD